jgi:hypothetical protein
MEQVRDKSGGFLLLVIGLTFLSLMGRAYGLDDAAIEQSPKEPERQRKVIAPEITDFRCEQIRSKKHLSLFYTEGDVKAAKKRARTLNYRQAIESLNSEAKKAREIVLESIDRSWWDEVKTKSWSETYPVIYEKTCLVPLRMAQPAHYAALRFAVRGDDKDAEAAKKILLHLSDYSFESEHYDVGMNYSV